MTASPSPLRGAIVAMNERRVIGVDGDLPWHYSADLKRFKQRTLNHVIVMGRLTWESIGARPLPRRRNIVLTRNQIEGVETFDSIDSLFDELGDDDTWFIGGGQIYRAVMPVLNVLDITLVPDAVSAESPVYFPEFNAAEWTLVSSEPLVDEPTLINQIYHRTG